MKREFDRALEIFRNDGIGQLSRQALSRLEYETRERLFERLLSNERLVTDGQLPDVCERIWHMGPEQKIEYTDPQENGSPAQWVAHVTNHRPKHRYVCEIPSCDLAGAGAVGFTDDGALILATASGNRTVLQYAWDWPWFLQNVPFRHLLFRTPLGLRRSDSLPQYVFPLVPFYRRYYYHWILEYLPKLRAMNRYEAETGIEPAILVRAEPPPFVVESLSLLGYSRERLVEWTGDTQHVENLVVTNHRTHLHYVEERLPHSLDDYRWLREQVTAAVDSPSESGRIYISRQEAERGRRVRNHDELMAELEPLGFRSVVMERRPFREQVELVKGAEAIVGPHGAGLVNMLFGTDPTVVELLPETDLRPHFYLLADILGFDYHCLVANADDRGDMDVDVGALRETLAEAGVG